MQVTSLSTPALWLLWDTALSWGAQGAMSLALACTEEVATTCSLPQVHGQKAAWEDPVEWVRDTLPWPSAQQDQSKLYHLPPPTIGPHSAVSPPEERSVKDTTPSSLDSDPLVCWATGGAGKSWGRAGLSFAFPVSSQCKKPDLRMQKHFALPGGAAGAGWWHWQVGCTPGHTVMCQ